jgi:hypothetical protein
MLRPHCPFSNRTVYLIGIKRKMLQVKECNLLTASAQLISRVFHINISSTFAGSEFLLLLSAHDAAEYCRYVICACANINYTSIM